MNLTKRSVAFVAAFIIVTLFAGCQKNDGGKDTLANVESTAPKATTEATEGTVEGTEGTVAPVVDNMVPADASRTGYITTKEAFTETVGKLVDLTLYKDLSEFTNGSLSSYSYSLKRENEKEDALDCTIALSDGTEVSLPISLPDLAKKGWKLQSGSQPERELESGYMTFGICENAAGRKIRVSAYNPTDAKITFDKCTVCHIEMNMFSTFERTRALSSAPGFVVCEEITHHATLEDIISALGAPTLLHYAIFKDENGAYDYSDLTVEYDRPTGILRFELSGDGNYIMTLEYTVPV